MSDFTDAFLELLPENSNLKNKDNDGRKVIDRTVGVWFDNHTTTDFMENLFFNTATGKYLDLFGADYSVTRQLNESDEDYRKRIVFEKLEYLTAGNLQEIYDLPLYSYVRKFDVHNNTLTSDNPYMSFNYMSEADDNLKNILNSKFVFDNGILWLNDGVLDYILTIYNQDKLYTYTDIYTHKKLVQSVSDDETIESVRLNLPVAVNVIWFLNRCINLVDAYVNMPEVTSLVGSFALCEKLETLTLIIPKCTYVKSCFNQCVNLKMIDATVPADTVDTFKNYVLGLSLPSLVSLKINGEEYL